MCKLGQSHAHACRARRVRPVGSLCMHVFRTQRYPEDSNMPPSICLPCCTCLYVPSVCVCLARAQSIFCLLEGLSNRYGSEPAECGKCDKNLAICYSSLANMWCSIRPVHAVPSDQKFSTEKQKLQPVSLHAKDIQRAHQTQEKSNAVFYYTLHVQSMVLLHFCLDTPGLRLIWAL